MVMRSPTNVDIIIDTYVSLSDLGYNQWSVIILNLHELSRMSKIPYTTVRKYVHLLWSRGYITPRREEKSLELSPRDIEIFERFVELVRSGLTLSTALERLGQSLAPTESYISEELYKLRKENEELRKEIQHLRELVELYLSTIMDISEKLKGLPPPKKTWRERIKEWFRKRRREEK